MRPFVPRKRTHESSTCSRPQQRFVASWAPTTITRAFDVRVRVCLQLQRRRRRQMSYNCHLRLVCNVAIVPVGCTIKWTDTGTEAAAYLDNKITKTIKSNSPGNTNTRTDERSSTTHNPYHGFVHADSLSKSSSQQQKRQLVTGIGLMLQLYTHPHMNFVRSHTYIWNFITCMQPCDTCHKVPNAEYTQTATLPPTVCYAESCWEIKRESTRNCDYIRRTSIEWKSNRHTWMRFNNQSVSEMYY